MTMLSMKARRSGTRAKGFSLLEVLIAIVVLSVGLLALAALQGNLTRSSADAKVRARVAAMLAARMDTLRQGGYGTLTPEGNAPVLDSVDGVAAYDCDTASPDATDWADCARTQSALGALRITQRIDTWQGAASFTQSVAANANIPQFKRITLGAQWTDAEGATRNLQLISDVSAMALTNNIVVPPDPTTTGGGGPIVRTTAPTAAGVIPLALSTESTSATSNPVPEMVGQKNNQKIVGTRFTVLNYTPPAGNSSAVVIQKRFENEVVKCSCRYGAGGTNLPVIYRTAQWPAIWTGDRYDVHVPDTPTAAPGQTKNAGPVSSATQSALCQECCRDHHDIAGTTDVKFDPERSDGSVAKYNVVANALVLVTDTLSGNYVDACRMIRIDGFWRTASDLYERQFGLLETTMAQGSTEQATNGTPSSAAVSRYTNFVSTFLDDYTGQGPPMNDAQTMFTADHNFNVPALITIPSPVNNDYRYLHARGLFVDHLEEKALTKLSDVLADTGTRGQCPSGTPVSECVLPYLPFTTANLTEVAAWAASNTGILTVNTNNWLSNEPAQPYGGRTVGKSNGSANNVATTRRSNSGVGVNLAMASLAGGVDPTDASATYSDQQAFQVGGGAGGPTFDVRVTGGGGNPYVFFTLGTDLNRECLKPTGTDHNCQTSSGTTLPQSGSILLSNYWIEDSTAMSITATCGGTTATQTLNVPTFHNYEISSALANGVTGTIGAPTNDGLTTETTSVVFASIAQGAIAMLDLTEQATSPVYATVTSCSTSDGTDILNPVWSRPWVP